MYITLIKLLLFRKYNQNTYFNMQPHRTKHDTLTVLHSPTTRINYYYQIIISFSDNKQIDTTTKKVTFKLLHNNVLKGLHSEA